VLGRDRELIPELAALTAMHPTRERLTELRMLALHRAGRTADALNAYAGARDYLAEHLGLDPGTGLRQMHQAILRDDLSIVDTSAEIDTVAGRPAETQHPEKPPLRPAQLPCDVPGFTGRARQLADLDALLDAHDAGGGTSPLIAAVTGTAGVGKTTLVVHWAHRVRHRFPDGQLYANLRGYAPTAPQRPIEALAGFLAALGVPPDKVPVDLEQAAALFRSLLADSRMLVVLDNARGPDQIRPLLPAGPGCMVLVTSRDRLAGMVAREGAHRVGLDVLSGEEAQTLLTSVLGAGRSAAEPGAVAALAEACAGLPLALRVAAANLAERPERRIAAQVDDLLAGSQLAALEVDGDEEAAVRGTFDLSYTALPADARRQFRLLGLVPGPDATVHTAAALAGTSPECAALVLHRLVAVHLLNEHVPGRYASHDLLRRYALERTGKEDGEQVRAAALRRLYGHYMATVDAAVDRLERQTLRVPREDPEPGLPTPYFADHADAIAWLDKERVNLVAAVTLGSVQGPLPATWQLADSLRGYFRQRTLVLDWLTVGYAGLAAARAGADLRGLAAAEMSLSQAYVRRAQYRDAIEHGARALALARRVGWLEAQGSVLNNLGIIYGEVGRLRLAAARFTQALEVGATFGDLISQGRAYCNLGNIYLSLGDLDRAASHYAKGAELYVATDARRGLGIALSNLGEVLHLRGETAQAMVNLERALGLNREVGDVGSESETLRILAFVERDRGDLAQALKYADASVAMARDSEDDWLAPGALNTLASVQRSLGWHSDALAHHQLALDLARGSGARKPEIGALLGLAAVHLDLGDHDGARSAAADALALARGSGYVLLEADAHAVLAATRT
jgi:tetratricopeptide (TPR) repeat protein